MVSGQWSVVSISGLLWCKTKRLCPSSIEAFFLLLRIVRLSLPLPLFVMYSHSKEVSSQCCVSSCSPSASLSLLIKCLSYLLLAQASAICPPTERDDLRSWSVNEYLSSTGKVFEISKILSQDVLQVYKHANPENF